MPDFGIFRGFNNKLFGDKLYAGQLPTQLGIIGSQEVFDFQFLLDLYPNAAAAYSLRKLRSNYTGSAIGVRRTDLEEMNIGFTSTGELDTSVLTTFANGGNVFVKTWYDQSGNGYNATEAAAIEQPQIVNAGVVLTKNDKPCIRISNTQCLTAAISPTLTYNTLTKQSTYGVFTPTNFSGGNFGRIFTQSPATFAVAADFDYTPPNWFPLYQSGTTSTYAQYVGGNRNINTLILNQQYCFASYNRGSGTFSIGWDDESILTTTGMTLPDYTSRGGLGNFRIGRALASPVTEKAFFDVQEIINYLLDNFSDRSDITTNINDYYGIY